MLRFALAVAGVGLLLPISLTHSQTVKPCDSDPIATTRLTSHLEANHDLQAQPEFDPTSGLSDSTCCGPWKLQVGGSLMKREGLDNIPLVTANLGAGPTILNAQDFQFDYEGGFDVSFGYRRDHWPAGIEFRYLWLNNWTDYREFAGLTNPVINTNPVNNPFVNQLESAYNTDLQSFELNLRCELRDWVSVLAGFRYVDLDEQLDLNMGAVNYWMTDNDLYGFQVGGDVRLYQHCCGLGLDFKGRAGIYGNDASTRTRISPVEQQPRSERSGMDHVGFVGELGLAASYCLSPCWTVRAGYEVMWVDGVLVAANQVPLTNNNANLLGFDYSSVLFHGATVSLEARW